MPLRRPPFDKLLQIRHRRHTQDEPPVLIRDDSKVLLLARRSNAGEEGLELLQGCLHSNDLVLGGVLATEAHHGGAHLIFGLDLAALEAGLQLRDGDVAEQGAGLRVDDGQVGVVALKGGEEGERDGVRGVEGEGGGRVEVFYCGLGKRLVF